MDTIKGKNIWIIGASSGIGEALARELNAQGATLTLSARSEDKLSALNRQLGKNHHVIPLDVGDAGAVKNAAASASEKLGHIDSVIFLAAIFTPGSLTDSKLDEIHKALNVNIGGAVNVVYETLPYLKNGSQIVLCGSVAGYRGLPNGQPYCATKAAIINLAESLKTDLDPRGIDVKVICPGFVKTPLTDKNDFEMPMMIEPYEAAKHIAKGLTSGAFEIHFPKAFTYQVKLLNFMIYPIFFWAMKKIAEKRKEKKNAE